MSRSQLDEFHRKTADHLTRYGRTIIGVFPGEGDDSPAFSYTIGNTSQGFPELLVIGSSHAPYLDDLSRLMIAAGKPFVEGQLVQVSMLRLPMKVVRAGNAARDLYTIQVGEFYGHQDYAILQLLISDTDGRFPDEPGCAEPWSTFPVLGGLS